MNDFLTVQCNGFVTYCDALIARCTDGAAQSFFFSLIGSPANIQASSAHFFSGGLCRVFDAEHPVFDLGRGEGNVHSIRAKKIGETVNKILINTDYFPGANRDSSTRINAAVVFGPDMDSVKERAFLRLDAGTTMPLKPEWRDWLWDEVLQPQKLFSFGGGLLQETWSISWQEENLEESILEGIRQKYLT